MIYFFILQISLFTLLISGCSQPISPADSKAPIASNYAGESSSVATQEREESDVEPLSSSTPVSSNETGASPETLTQSSVNAPKLDGSTSHAVAEARRLYEESKVLSATGDHVKAFLAARDALVIVKELNDLDAEPLSQELFSRISILAEKASQLNRDSLLDTSRPLLLK